MRVATERAVAVARDVEVAVRRGGDVDRVVRSCGRSEQREVEAFWNPDVFEDGGFCCGREFDDLRCDVALLVVLVRIGIFRGRLLLLGIELGEDRLDAGAFHADLEDAGPTSGAGAGAGDDQAFDALRAELVFAVAGLLVVRGIDEEVAGFAVRVRGHGFDLVAVAVVVALPDDLDAVEVLRLVELELDPLRHRGTAGAPARVLAAVDRVPHEVVLAGLLAVRGDGHDGRALRCRAEFFDLRRRLVFFLDQRDFVFPGERFLVFRGELVAGPQQPARDEIEVALVGHGRGVVADGGAEAARALFLVRPRDDRRHGLAVDHLLAHRERVGVEDFRIVVEFFLVGGPIFERLGDRVLFVDESDLDRFLRSVRVGGEAEVLEPLVGAAAEAVHGAM